MYEMITLRHAFDANSMKGLVLKILRGSYPEIQKCYSQTLRELIADMLIKDPKKRPSIRKVLEKDFLSKRIQKLLSETVIKHEFSSTFLQKNIPNVISGGTDEENKIEKFKKQPMIKEYFARKKEQLDFGAVKEKSQEPAPPKAASSKDDPEKTIPHFLNNLPGVAASDSMQYRMEALRVYLEGKLGDTTFVSAYQTLIASTEQDDDDEAESALDKLLDQKQREYLPLIHWLIVCEDSYYNRLD